MNVCIKTRSTSASRSLIVRSLKVRIVTELTKAPNFAQQYLIAVP